MYLLGIDVGTGGSRAILISTSGTVVCTVSEDHQPFASAEIGWAEQDPNDWWMASSKAVREICGKAGIDSTQVLAVSFSGQMHGAVLLDKDDEVLRPALIWCDQRTEAECRQITDRFGKEKLIEMVSNPALTNLTLTKLLWVRNNEPEIWDRVATVMLPKDYVRFCLTGEKATEVSDASGTLMLDVRNRCWSKEIVEGLGMDTSILPALHESQDVAGTVSNAGAEATGLKAGTPVIAGAGDNAAGAIGMGIVKPGTASVTIGTSGVAFAVTDQPKIDLKGRIHSFCHAVPGRWHVTGVTQAAGFSLRWFRDNFATGADFDELVAGAEQIAAGAEGLFWTPYLMGERTPHIDPDTRASLIGLTAIHTRSHVVRAILEGVAFSLRDCLEVFKETGIPMGKIRLGGGGAKSVLWKQIQADIYGAAVETIAAEEGAAYGAALLAGVGSGVWNSVDEACAETIRVTETIEPDKKNMEFLNGRFGVYQNIYNAVKPILDN